MKLLTTDPNGARYRRRSCLDGLPRITTKDTSPQYNTYYLSNLNGDCKLFPVSRTSGTYALKLTGKTTNASFPQLDGARIYISIGQKLMVDTEISAPSGQLVGRKTRRAEDIVYWRWAIRAGFEPRRVVSQLGRTEESNEPGIVRR
jgi:hypothetical protein